MPNWCGIKLTVRSPSDSHLSAGLKDLLSFSKEVRGEPYTEKNNPLPLKPLCFNKILPIPTTNRPDNFNVEDWCVSNWGTDREPLVWSVSEFQSYYRTKWALVGNEVVAENELAGFEYSIFLSTRWDVPHNMMEFISLKYPNLDFVWKYSDPNSLGAYVVVYKNGNSVEEELSEYSIDELHQEFQEQDVLYG